MIKREFFIGIKDVLHLIIIMNYASIVLKLKVIIILLRKLQIA